MAHGAQQNGAFRGAKFGRALADLFNGAGIPITERDGRLVAVGVSLKQCDDRALLPHA
jgi:hypothetical protein